MQIDATTPTPTADPIPAFAPMESPLACGTGVSIGDNVDVVVGVICEELKDVVEDAEEGFSEALVVEVGPIVSGMLIAAWVSQQVVFDSPQHQVVAVEASPPQGVTGALPLVS
ncbi:hypothetical protein VE03_04483 [Pseudogymnoascus sp. 23342-1-I1]|nr:hypothetical protein VE03_04483 [Pseudogymnoascus sp. 23342-1-I1]